jgi:hypothetical protein
MRHVVGKHRVRALARLPGMWAICSSFRASVGRGSLWQSTALDGRTRKEPTMKTRRRRLLRRVALVAVAALIAVMSGNAAAGDVDANDLAHYGRSQTLAPTPPSAIPATAPPSAVVVRVDGGFDWLDAGVGAAGALGLALALGGAASTVRRRRADVTPQQSLAKGL